MHYYITIYLLQILFFPEFFLLLGTIIILLFGLFFKKNNFSVVSNLSVILLIVIAFLIYLNKDWKESYGGHLELWSKNMSSCEKKILSSFNTMAIFSTTDFSNHGHPDPLDCPMEMSRKSIALYYFSSGRPEEEILKSNTKNRTYFKSRINIKDDADEKKEFFKNYIRKFKFYQFLKNFEKKYIRKGKKISKDE